MTNDSRAPGIRDEAGMALVTVIAITSVLAILMVAAVSMAVGGLQKSRNDQDWSAALAAAYAGVEEYQSRLADDPSYWAFGDPASGFSNPTSVADPGVELPSAAQTNPAFGLGATGTWAIVGNSDADNDGATAYFRYEVNNTDYNSKGIIQLRSTGRVGGETRTLVAHLRQSGFLDFVYFTDFEFRDPAMSGESCNGELRQWQPGYNCNNNIIQFGNSDDLNGPVHSNDTILTCSARFREKVTTGAPGGDYNTSSGTCNPQFDQGPPVTVPLLGMPETNDIMQRYTRSDLQAADVPTPGCMYTGPTEIKLLSSGKMTVKSPWTNFTNVTGDDLKGGVINDACGTTTDLQSSGGATVTVPANNVVYVQNIPDESTNANFTHTNFTTTGSNCIQRRNGTTIPRTSTHSETVNSVGYPKHYNEQAPSDGTGSDKSYGCRNGDLFIDGTLSGTSVTFAAQNYIYVTGDIRYQSGEPDTKLGLIGTNAVWVWNPMTSGGTALNFPTSNKNRRIDGAVMSVRHSFGVQNYTRGNELGDLTIYGALVQKYRGTVGTTGPTGFDKDYRYDPDFKYNPPPRFLSPTNSTFGVKTWIEVSPAFHADGS